MFNAAIESRLLGLVCATVLTASFSSCGNGNGEKEAAALVAEATTALDNGDYTTAISLADSVKRAYPRAIEARRQALHITSVATGELSVRSLESADSLLAVLAIRADSLKPLVKYVDNPVEGYYIAAADIPDAVRTTSGLQARLSPEGDFYIIATLKAPGVKTTSVSVSDGQATATTATVPYDGERNDRYGGLETITFIAAECDTVGSFIASDPGRPMSLTFNGEAGSRTIDLPATTASRIATLHDYAVTMRRARVAAIEKERLSRTVDIARSQAARTYVE